jgi:hypothetical protein
MRKGWVLLALLASTAGAQVSAAPNYLGSTGLLLTPTADVLRMREWNAYAFGTDDFFSFGANFGLFENFELGATGFDPDFGDTEVLINLKYRLLPESERAPGIAIGVVDIADEFDVDPSIYLVVSKALGTASAGSKGLQIRGHLGIGDGIYDTIFGGVDIVLSPQALLLVEYDSDDFNFGVRFGVSQEVRIDVSLLDGDFGAGISFNAAF